MTYLNLNAFYLYHLLNHNIHKKFSTAQRGPFTRKIEFEVLSRPTVNVTIVIVTCIVIVGAMIAVCSGLLVLCYRRGMRKKLDPDYIMKVVSANPDYIGSNDAYKKDQWELDRDSIELLEKIGSGSFGVVYAGRYCRYSYIYLILAKLCLYNFLSIYLNFET